MAASATPQLRCSDELRYERRLEQQGSGRISLRTSARPSSINGTPVRSTAARTGALTYTPAEFGALNLFPSDPLFQHPNGLIGQMIIEPAGSKWTCGDAGATGKSCEPISGPASAQATTRAQATVTAPNQTFREFSVMISDALQTSLAGQGTAAVNYRSEPKAYADNFSH